MLIQWCLKGIPATDQFDDKAALSALSDEGLTASWLRNAGLPLKSLPQASHAALSQAALDAHVNGFGAASYLTPYISLSAGCVELDPTTRTTKKREALLTALDFATNGGQTDGFVFYLWILVSPKAAAELPGFGEEVRELNIFQQYAVFHYEGEIAAKLFIPARQIYKFRKYAVDDLSVINEQMNGIFVPPDRLSNVLELI